MNAFLFLFLLGNATAIASGRNDVDVLSPNHRFEAHSTAHFPDGTGTQLFLRTAGSKNTGALLLQNDRWIEVHWSPDSRFLAVVDGSDGHVTDIFVYRIRTSLETVTKVTCISNLFLGDFATYGQAPHVVANLCYHTPNLGTYDVQWAFVRWKMSEGAIDLSRAGRKLGKARITVVLDSASISK